MDIKEVDRSEYLVSEFESNTEFGKLVEDSAKPSLGCKNHSSIGKLPF